MSAVIHPLQAIHQAAARPVDKDRADEAPIHGAARQIFGIFSQTEGSAKTRVMLSIFHNGLTVEEYAAAEKEAAAMAKEADRLSGWSTEGKKGRDAYGPKQSTCASQASMRRQVYGALRLAGVGVLVHVPDGAVINPDLIPTWAEAYAKAKAFLHQQGVDWMGEKTEDARRNREAKAAKASADAAEEQLMKDNPQQAGESYGQYKARIAGALDKAIEQQRAAEAQATLADVAKKLIEKHGADAAREIGKMLLQLTEPAPL
jgi:hypothetical protein